MLLLTKSVLVGMIAFLMSVLLYHIHTLLQIVKTDLHYKKRHGKPTIAFLGFISVKRVQTRGSLRLCHRFRQLKPWRPLP